MSYGSRNGRGSNKGADSKWVHGAVMWRPKSESSMIEAFCDVETRVLYQAIEDAEQRGRVKGMVSVVIFKEGESQYPRLVFTGVDKVFEKTETRRDEDEEDARPRRSATSRM